MPAAYDVPARLRAGLERRLGPQLGAFLKKQGDAVGEAYGVGGLHRVGVTVAQATPALQGLLKANYTFGVDAQAAARFDMLQVAPRYIEPHVIEFAERQSAAKVVDINLATMRRIQNAVKGSIEESLTLAEQARAIREALVGASKARSFAIARTEVGTATAFGDHLAAKESGLSLVKVWLTASSGFRHPTYPGLDGQTREMDEPFQVGDALLQFPLDPDGPPEETVNCRCVLDYQRRRG